MSITLPDPFPPRIEAVIRAAHLLSTFIKNSGLKSRPFAEAAGIPESTLRSFLKNGTPTSKAVGHKFGPYRDTLRPLLSLQLPLDLYSALKLAIDYEEFAVARLKGQKHAQSLREVSASHSQAD